MINQEYTTFLIRLALGFIYLSAGWAKFAPHDLGNLIGPVDASQVTESVILLSTFKFIAFFQVIIGALILSQRYSLIGLLALFPLSLGIFIFTIVAGFGGTPFINLIFLMMNCPALNMEKENIKVLFKRNYSALKNSVVAVSFPDKHLPYISFGLLVILMLCSFIQQGIILNIIAVACLITLTINLLQYKRYHLIDKLTLILFFVICFITTNGIALNRYIDSFFFYVFYLILIGFVLYLIRLAIFSKRKSGGQA